MTVIKQKVIEEIENMPDDQVAYVMQVIQGLKGFLNKKQDDRMESFNELDRMLKTGTVTDYDAELNSYRDEKYGV